MATATLKTELTKLRKAASERIDCADKLEVGELTPDLDFVRQGDIFIFCRSGVPAGFEFVANPGESEWQLAIGNTQGSRHIVSAASRDSVKLYRRKNAGDLVGPVLECPDGVAIEHPEHGWIVLGPGVYAIGYQRVWADQVRRVAD